MKLYDFKCEKHSKIVYNKNRNQTQRMYLP